MDLHQFVGAAKAGAGRTYDFRPAGFHSKRSLSQISAPIHIQVDWLPSLSLALSNLSLTPRPVIVAVGLDSRLLSWGSLLSELIRAEAD